MTVTTTRTPQDLSTGCGRERWWELAHCRNLEPEIFFTDSQRHLALHHCLYHCAVLAQCRREALELKPSYVVQGGIPWNAKREPLGWAVKPSRKCGICGAPPPPERCGSNAGYRRHQTLGEQACGPCRGAHARYRAGRRSAGRVLVGTEEGR